MWKCPKCGEEIEDRFDSCWKCAKVQPLQEVADDRPARTRVGFWQAWRRGWLVLAMMIVYRGLAKLVSMFFEHNTGPIAIVGVGVALFLLPAGAYLIFVLFFGAWPLGSTVREMPRDERVAALLDEAMELEARGNVKEALAKYKTLVKGFPGATASHDAQKGIENLRSKLG